MMIVCDVTECPYIYQGFCSNKVVRIMPNGVCHHVTKRNWRDPVDSSNKEFPNILNIIKREESTEISEPPKKKRGRPKKIAEGEN